jgi:hypothetical protein
MKKITSPPGTNQSVKHGRRELSDYKVSAKDMSTVKTTYNAETHLLGRMDERDEADRRRRQLEAFRPIERPSQAGSSEHDLATTRRVLGLEIDAHDPNLVKVPKNLSWNYLRVIKSVLPSHGVLVCLSNVCPTYRRRFGRQLRCFN